MRYRWSSAAITIAMMTVCLIAPSISVVGAEARQTDPSQSVPGEVLVGGVGYTFDREVPIDLAELQQLSDDAGTAVYVKPDVDPLDAVYLPIESRPGVSARYLPQNIGAPEAACPSEALDQGTIQSPAGTYVPIGLEPDLSAASLVEIGSTDDGRIVYAPSPDQPFNELFVTGSEDGLVRHALVSDESASAAFPQALVFGGQQFQLSTEAQVDADGLAKVGCAVQAPALASEGEIGSPFSAIHLQVGDRFVTYIAVDMAVGTPDATPPAAGTPEATIAVPPGTPVQTLVPIGPPESTETQAPPATVAPTETQEATNTVAPTQPPTATSTVAPTQPPTATSTVAPTATLEPTITATSTVAPEITETAAAAATAAPTDSVPTATAPVATQPAIDPTEQVVSRPTPTPRLQQQPAFVPTLPPEAPPPAVATAPAPRCSGEAGEIGDDGVPERLPQSLQYGGTGYHFIAIVSPDDAGSLTLLGCVGPFEAFRGDTADAGAVIFLSLPNLAESVYRYEAISSFNVSYEVSDDPRTLTLPGTGDQADVQYFAADPWARSVYSSVTLILYVSDTEQANPERVLGVAVDADVIGEYLPMGEADPASAEVLAAAGEAGVLPELRLGTSEESYVLVSLWRPFGTSTNGWLTLFSPEGEEAPAQLVGVDPRRLDLLVFDRRE